MTTSTATIAAATSTAGPPTAPARRSCSPPPTRSHPEHCDPTNLRAYCQACHLSYDAEHHRATAAATRRADLERQMEPLFEVGDR